MCIHECQYIYGMLLFSFDVIKLAKALNKFANFSLAII